MKQHGKRVLSCLLALSMLTSISCALKVGAEGGYTLPNTYDFSEHNMVSNSSCLAPGASIYTPDDGGTFEMALAYLARRDGAVLENEDPYPEDAWEEDIKYREIEASLYASGALALPVPSTRAARQTLKQAVLDYGAAYLPFPCYFSCFSDDGSAYRFPGELLMPSDERYGSGHAVTVVGWDDDYPRENFGYKPLRDGAFICKNSWGTMDGEDGFFYISYYSEYYDYHVPWVLEAPEMSVGCNKLYDYDVNGLTDTFDPERAAIECAANVFPESGKALASDETLRRVSFYTTQQNTRYDIMVVTDVRSKEDLAAKIKAGDFACEADGALGLPGYHIIDIDPVTLKAGTRFAVAVRLTDRFGVPRSKYPVENTLFTNARANPDESYYYYAGTCYDLTYESADSNWCIKAFTDDAGAERRVMNAIDNAGRAYVSDTLRADAAAKSVKPEKPERSGKATGARPAPVKMDVVAENNMENAALPERYDMREEGLVSPVRNQFSVGSCWAFSAIAVLESAMLKRYGADGVGLFDGVPSIEVGQTRSGSGSADFAFTPGIEGDYTIKCASSSAVRLDILSEYGVTLCSEDGAAGLTVSRGFAAGATVILRLSLEASSAFSVEVTFDDGFSFDGATPLEYGKPLTVNPSGESFDVYCFDSLADEDYYDDTEIFFTGGEARDARLYTEDGVRVPTDFCGSHIYEDSDKFQDYHYFITHRKYYLVIERDPAASEPYRVCVGFSSSLDRLDSDGFSSSLDRLDSDGSLTLGVPGGDTDRNGILFYSFVPERDGCYLPISTTNHLFCAFLDAEYNYIYTELERYWEENDYADPENITKDMLYYRLTAGDTYYVLTDISKPDDAVTVREYREGETDYSFTIDGGGYGIGYTLGEGDRSEGVFVPASSGEHFIRMWAYGNYSCTLTSPGGAVLGTWESYYDDGFWDGYMLTGGGAVSLEAGERYTVSFTRLPGEDPAYHEFRMYIDPVDGTIAEGTPVTLGEGSGVYSFSPSADGDAVIDVRGDANVDVLDSNGEHLGGSSHSMHDGADSYLFGLYEDMEAGEKYYLFVTCDGESTLLVAPPEDFAAQDAVLTPGEVRLVYLDGSFAADMTVSEQASGDVLVEIVDSFSDIWLSPSIDIFSALCRPGDSLSILSFDFSEPCLALISVRDDIDPSPYYQISGRMNLRKGGFSWLRLERADERFRGDVTWSSSDESVASVDSNGRISAKAPGSALITARTDEGVETSAAVVVRQAWWQVLLRLLTLGWMWR